MINMAVFSLKDIIKYLIKVTIIIAIVIGFMRYFSSAKENVSKQAQTIEASYLTSCLDTTIPGIASINKEEKEKINVNPLKTTLTIELSMLSSLEDEINLLEETMNTADEKKGDENEANDNQNEENNNEEEPIQTAETGLKTEVQSSNVPEKYTSEYNRCKNKK